MFLSGIVSLLLFLAVVSLIVRALRGRRDEEESSAVSLRRLFQYALLFSAMAATAVGLGGLISGLVPTEEAIAGRGAADLARALALTVVGAPVFTALWVFGERTRANDPAESGSAAWALYLNIALLASLVTAMVSATQIGAWLLGVEDLPRGAVGRTVVWAAAWAFHWQVAADPSRRPTVSTADLPSLVGAGVGLIGAAFGLSLVVVAALDAVYRLTAANLIAGHPFEALRLGIVGLVVSLPVWWFHWLRGTAGRRQESHQTQPSGVTPERRTGSLAGPQSRFWHGYLVVAAVPGGLAALVAGAGYLIFKVLEWVLARPDADMAAHFDGLPSGLTSVLVGGLVWWYHRSLLEAEPHGEAHRAAAYLTAGGGVLVVASGAVNAVVAGVAALAGTTDLLFDPRPDRRLVIAITLLVVGVPLWRIGWRQITSWGTGPDELGSPSRRVFLTALFGLGGTVTAVSLIVILFRLFEALFGGNLGREAIHDVRVAIGLVVAAGLVAGIHWPVWKADRAATVPSRQPAEVLLVGGEET
ncbi:MAG: DUF5671 domain-containing protein, partial [Acidimicrobiia bacterium]